MARYKCPLCGCAFLKHASVLYHINKDHKFEPYKIKCGIQGCPAEYVNTEGLRTHIRRKHKDKISEYETTSINQGYGNDFEGSQNEEGIQEEHHYLTSKEAMKKSSARYILKVWEIHRLPQKTVNELIKDTRHLYKEVMHHYQEETRNVLEAVGVDTSESNPELYCHLDIEALPDPFEGLETQHFQRQYFLDKFGLIVSLYIYVCT